MRILAVDTTSEHGSVAVVENGLVRGELRLTTENGHSARLMPAIEFLLRALELPLRGVEGYAVAAGPGSFTGLRIGLSTIQGLALGHRRPCAGISALDALASRAESYAEAIVAWIDAFRGEVYAATYDGHGERMSGEARLGAPETLLASAPRGAAFVGSGAARYKELILARDPSARLPARSSFLAGAVGRLGERQLVAGRGVGPEALRPLYLRGVDTRRAGP